MNKINNKGGLDVVGALKRGTGKVDYGQVTVNALKRATAKKDGKHYSLIVQDRFSLANETDSDIQSDYSPGIWAIKTQKSALRFSKEILSEGGTITVTDYNNPNYHALANWFIKELGLDQPLFIEPVALVQKPVTNGKPQNLSQLKKYLTVGKVIGVVNFDSIGEMRNNRDTSVLAVQTNSAILEKTLGSGIKSWLDLGKASDWSFDNDGATKNYLDRDGFVPSTRIIYRD